MTTKSGLEHLPRNPYIEAVKGWLYPSKCPLCGAFLPKGQELLCDSCQKQLPWTDLYRSCYYGTDLFKCWSVMLYQEPLKASFQRYKFQGRWQYSALYSRWLIGGMGRFAKGERFDVITWIPLNRWRLLRRGYDQTRLLAQPVARALERPLQPTLVKAKRIPAQSHLRQKELRRENVKNAFVLRRGVDLAGKRVLLVDDVITTGSTLEEAARVLLEGGAHQVCGLTLARSTRLN